MSKIEWDVVGERFYETGVDHGVLYPMGADGTYSKGVAWNGLSAVTDSPSGAEASPVYADNIKYLNLMSAEEFNATIEAYTCPDEFAACEGSVEVAPGAFIGQQDRKTFGFAYRTLVGNDTMGTACGYKIHLVYGALAAPTERNYATVNDSPEAATLSWEISTTPVSVTGKKPTATFIIDSTKTTPEKMAAVEAILYGTNGADGGAGGTDARLPLPDELITLLTDGNPSG